MIYLGDMKSDNKNTFWFLAGFYWFWCFLLAIYSYSQIDLNLTLSSNFFYQNIQQNLIYLGYFNRSVSTLIFFLLGGGLTIFWFHFQKLAKLGKINKKQLLYLIVGVALIFLFAYPAFSHDIFNYIFDVRILLVHHASPWLKTALDFPADPWTRFMHWTHRTYPYGPFWLVFTIPVYFLGWGKFVLTLLAFKFLAGISYILSCYLLLEICRKTNRKEYLPVVLFGFNPLIIIEGLISSHLDIFMAFLGILSIFLFLNAKKILAGIVFILSFLVKYATFGYLPFFIIKAKFSKKILVSVLFTGLIVLAEIITREIYPWYFIPLIAIACLSEQKLIYSLLVGLGLSGILYYLPYLYIGDYSVLVNQLTLTFFILPIIAAVFAGLYENKK